MIGTILFGSASLICTSYVLAIGVPLISWTDALSIALQVSLVISLLNITVIFSLFDFFLLLSMVWLSFLQEKSLEIL
jgi:hypothetical protein